MSTPSTLGRLAGERFCLAVAALSGDRAINDAEANAHAGAMPRG